MTTTEATGPTLGAEQLERVATWMDRAGLPGSGGACEIVLDAFPDRRYRGVVVEVTPRLNRAKATATVKVKLVVSGGKSDVTVYGTTQGVRADAQIGKLAVQGGPSNPQSPRNFGHTTAIMADGEADDVGLYFFQRA